MYADVCYLPIEVMSVKITTDTDKFAKTILRPEPNCTKLTKEQIIKNMKDMIGQH